MELGRSAVFQEEGTSIEYLLSSDVRVFPETGILSSNRRYPIIPAAPIITRSRMIIKNFFIFYLNMLEMF